MDKAASELEAIRKNALDMSQEVKEIWEVLNAIFGTFFSENDGNNIRKWDLKTITRSADQNISELFGRITKIKNKFEESKKRIKEMKGKVNDMKQIIMETLRCVNMNFKSVATLRHRKCQGNNADGKCKAISDPMIVDGKH